MARLHCTAGMGPTVPTDIEQRRQTVSGHIGALRNSQRGRMALYVISVALVAAT